MYGVAGEKRPIFVESDAFLYNLGDPTTSKDRVTNDYVHQSVEGSLLFVPREYDICNIVHNTTRRYKYG
jgi:hypothetical protein